MRFTDEHVVWQKEHWIRGQETYFGQPWAGPAALRASVPLGRGVCSVGWFLKTADLALGLRLAVPRGKSLFFLRYIPVRPTVQGIH